MNKTHKKFCLHNQTLSNFKRNKWDLERMGRNEEEHHVTIEVNVGEWLEVPQWVWILFFFFKVFFFSVYLQKYVYDLHWF